MRQVNQIKSEKKQRMVIIISKACCAKACKAVSDDAAKCRKPVICFKLVKDLPCSLRTGSTAANAAKLCKASVKGKE